MMSFADELREKTEEALIILEEHYKKVAEVEYIACKGDAFEAAKCGKYEIDTCSSIYEDGDEIAERIADMCVNKLKSCGLSVERKMARKTDKVIDGCNEYIIPIHISWYPESKGSK